MAKQPQLLTERLLLRPLQESDRHLYHQLYSDAKVMRNIDEPFSAEKIDQWFDKNLNQLKLEQPSILCWQIQQQSDSQSIGIISLYQINTTKSEAGIGLMLSPQYWTKGYGSESLHILTNYSFKNLLLKRLLGYCYPANKAMVNCFTKQGFSLHSELNQMRMYIKLSGEFSSMK